MAKWAEELLKDAIAQAKIEMANTEIERLRAENEELMTVLKKIATMHHSNASAAAVAQSAIDTIKALHDLPEKEAKRVVLELAAIRSALW